MHHKTQWYENKKKPQWYSYNYQNYLKKYILLGNERLQLTTNLFSQNTSHFVLGQSKYFPFCIGMTTVIFEVRYLNRSVIYFLFQK